MNTAKRTQPMRIATPITPREFVAAREEELAGFVIAIENVRKEMVLAEMFLKRGAITEEYYAGWLKGLKHNLAMYMVGRHNTSRLRQWGTKP